MDQDIPLINIPDINPFPNMKYTVLMHTVISLSLSLSLSLFPRRERECYSVLQPGVSAMGMLPGRTCF